MLDACSHFSWITYSDATPSQCFLFRNCESREACSECATAITGPAHPNYGEACCSVFAHSICGLDQSDLHSVRVNTKSPTECQQLCQEETTCTHFTHDIDTCFLFSSCHTYEDCDTCISGPTTPSLEICQATHPGNYILMIGGSGGSDLLASSELLTPHFACPDPLPLLPVATKGWSANYLSGSLLLCGGQDLDSIIAPALLRVNRRCWTLSSMHTDQWEETFSLSLRRTFHATVATSGHVWAFGGENLDETGAFQQLNAVESFTWSRGWEKRPEYELNPTRSAACAVALDDDNIFLLGGLTTPNTEANQTKAVLDSVVKMNSTGGWVALSPMLQPRYHAACTTYTFEGKRGIVVSGGMGLDDKGPCNTVEFYDVEEDIWERMPAMVNARCGHSMSHLNGVLTVFGGHHNGTSITNVEEFKRDQWENTFNTGGEGRHYFASADIPPEWAPTFDACNP